MKKRYLVTGGCGFLGTNLARAVLAGGGELTVFDSLRRLGSTENLAWLRTQGDFRFVHGDVRNAGDVDTLIREARPDVVWHLAGQVAMTTSLENPRLDFETNALGTFQVLEALRRHAPEATLVYSSTNKVYGDLEHVRYEETATRYVAPDHPHGFDERVPLDFRSPYGCSKGAADQYVLDSARCWGLRAAVFRHSSIFGTRQFSTFDQGWIGWFVAQALATRAGELAEPFTISGNGKQVRDVLFADDLVRCYLAATEHADRIAGRAFNIGGGMQNSLSLLELFAMLEELLGIRLSWRETPWRRSDQKVFVADTRGAREAFGWEPEIDARSGVRAMIDWVSSQRA